VAARVQGGEDGQVLVRGDKTATVTNEDTKEKERRGRV
jgi:hypothetical protein